MTVWKIARLNAEDAANYALDHVDRIHLPSLKSKRLDKGAFIEALFKFHPFPKLPFELRMKILRTAMKNEGGAGGHFYFGISRNFVNMGFTAARVGTYGSSHEKLLRKFGSVCADFRAEMFAMHVPLLVVGSPRVQLWDGTTYGNLGGPWDVKSPLTPFDRLINVHQDTLFLDYEEIKAAWSIAVWLPPSRVKYVAIWFDPWQSPGKDHRATCFEILLLLRRTFPGLRELSICLGRRPATVFKEDQSNGFVEIDDRFEDMLLVPDKNQTIGSAKAFHSRTCEFAEQIKQHFNEALEIDLFWTRVEFKVQVPAFMSMIFNGWCHLGGEDFCSYPSPRYDSKDKSFVLRIPSLDCTTPCDEEGNIILLIENIRNLFKEPPEPAKILADGQSFNENYEGIELLMSGCDYLPEENS